MTPLGSRIKHKVVFVSSVFDEVDTGPGVYARYLWRAFCEDPEIEFHVVAPVIAENHMQLHTSGAGRNSLDTYARLQQTAYQLAQSLDTTPVIHGNAAHSMNQLAGGQFRTLVQVNDYEAADVWKRPTKIVFNGGLRRFASLAWRHGQEKRVIRKATRILCNSEYTREVVKANYWCEGSGDIVVIHKAVDISKFSSEPTVPDPYPQRPDHRRLLFVGSDWKRKGLLDLFSALGHLRRRTNSSTHLTVVGPSGPDEIKFLKNRAEKERLERCVLFAGRVDRESMVSLYRTSDAFVLPSYFEAFGVVLLEAMAAGLPVVCTRVGGMEEIVRDGRCASTFEAGDVDQLVRSVEAVLSDAELRADMIKAGRARAEEFAVEKMVTQIRDLYVSVLAEQENVS